MKKLFYLLLTAVLVVSFKTTPKKIKNYVILSGKITNQESDSLLIVSKKGYHKKIKLDTNGIFKDTLNIKTGYYFLLHHAKGGIAYLFLKNGDDLKITLNTKEFNKTITYTGIGSEVNNYLVKQNSLIKNVVDDTSLFDLDKSQFEQKANSEFTAIQKLLDSLSSKFSFDTSFVAHETERIKAVKENFFKKYSLSRGKPSPKFTNYENFKGGTTSLNDFKGKYVYIDLWATWCGPCKVQIPFLKKLEKKYHGKNIAFISISIDKKLSGVQLIADNNWESQFVRGYHIYAIPRFILIDPQGNIVNSYAPRPSNPALTTLLDGLKL